MTFSSVTFVVFFGILMLCLFLIQYILKITDTNKQKLCHYLLLIASYIFYGWWDWRFCFLLLAVTAISFYTAETKDSITGNGKKIKMWAGIIVPLVVLGIFKYYNFFIDSFCDLFGVNNSLALNIILPVGISFYTFQALSYNIDVYNGNLKKEESFVDYALYISFFPQLVAGPIVKASEFLPQLKERRVLTLAGIEKGVQIFLFGLFKKIVLADNLSIFVDDVFSNPMAFNGPSILLAVISYAIQIYLDFSGYSDMAVGCANCIGYTFPKNFNMPYISQNVSEFWKRWHISLSSWLMQYLYIPLGGNRKGTMRTYLNLMITMLLGGLWHGSNWTFVIWGGLHGLALCVHKLWTKYIVREKKKPHILKTCCNIALTNIYVCLCWIFFRAETLDSALLIIKRIFLWSDGLSQPFAWSFVAIVLLIVCTFIGILISNKNKEITWNGHYITLNLNTFWGLFVVMLVFMLILGLGYVQGNPFVYFQF